MKHELNDQQKVLIELWIEFDRICTKYGISYQLFAGTALGAVRHQGIIPWDDDLDVVMMREDYEKFLSVCEDELNGELYFMQKEFSKHWPMFYSKLRKNNTAFMEKTRVKDPLMHQGIYIDIFPCDSLSDSKWMRKIQFFASKVVIAKSLDQRGYLTDSFIKKAFILVCRCLPMRLFVKTVQLNKKKNTEFVHTFFGAASSYEKNIYPRVWFKQSVQKNFEGYKAPVSKCFHELLTKLYGEYMIPHAPEQREVKVHAAIVDVHQSYEVYLEAQKNMEITTFTRSIR